MIVGVAGEEPDVRAFRIVDGEVSEQELEVRRMSQALVCPSCATPARGSASASAPTAGCRSCISPEAAAAAPRRPRRRSARARSSARYAEGPLVRVAAARHQAEAEFLQGLLLEEGIPSMMRRSGGFDVPDFLAAGPRDIARPAVGRAGRARGARHHRAAERGRVAAAGWHARGCARWRRRSPCSLVAIVAAGVIAAMAP